MSIAFEQPQISLNLSEIRSTSDADVHDNDRLCMLKEYWLSKCKDGKIPTRAEIDPAELKRLLGWIFIVQYRPVEDDFYYRLIGSNLTMLHGRELTKKTVADVFEPYGKDIAGSVTAGYKKVIRESISLRVKGRFIWANKAWMHFDSIHFPLRNSRGEGDMVIGLLDFGDKVAS